MTTIYTPRQEHKNGSDCTGSDGDLNRTYTLAYTPSADEVNVYVQGVKYFRDIDFTFNGVLITFLPPIEDFMAIELDYYTTSVVGTPSYSGLLRYSNTTQLAAVLNISKNVPDWDPGTIPTFELVGAGDNSNPTFYLDYRNVLGASYFIYYGTTQAAASLLTETTHYSLDKDTGKITLTAAGITLVGTKNIYAEYSYTLNGVKESFLAEVLLRAERQVDKELNTTFTNGTVANPSYPTMIEEEQDSQGLFNRVYFTKERPIINIGSTLASDITSTANTLTVKTGDGTKFPLSGYIVINNELISYSGITGNTFTGLVRGIDGSDATNHTSGDEINTTVIQISSTAEGGVPTWYTLKKGTDVEFEMENGKIYIYGNTIYSNAILANYITINGLMPKQGVMVRFKTTYLYGWDSVPADITRLTLLLAQRMLFTDTVMSSLVKGRNEFRPELMNIVREEIQEIEDNYRHLDMQNT